MPEAATLPTRRDEAWRYADIGALERLGAPALDQWREMALAPSSGKTSENGHFLIQNNFTGNFNIHEWN